MFKIKRKISFLGCLLCLLCALCIQQAHGQANTLRIVPVSITYNSEGEITLALENTVAASAFQFVVNLPAGFKYVDNSAILATERKADHQLSTGFQNGKLTIIGFSASGADLKGTTGAFVKFRLSAPAQPGNYTLSLSNVEFSDKAGTAVNIAAQSGNVSVFAPQLSSSNTIDFGRVPIREERLQYVYVSNAGNQSLTISEIKSNDSRFVVNATLPIVIAPGSGYSLPVYFQSDVKGVLEKQLTITSNSATEPVKTIALKATAFAVNEMRVGSVTSKNLEEATIFVSVNNMEAFSGIGFKMPLTDEMEYVTGSVALGSRKEDHTVSANIKDKVLTVVAVSASNKAFKLNEGEVLTFRLKTAGQGTFPLSLQNAEIADLTGENVISATYNGSLTIQSPYLSLSAGTIDFGRVAVTEFGQQTITIYNSGQADLVITGLGLASTYFTHNLTFPVTITAGSSRNVAFSFAGAPAGVHQLSVKLYHSDKNRNPTNITLKAIAFEPNELRIADMSGARGGMLQAKVELKNYSNVVGFQFDVALPTGFTSSKADFKLTSRASDHSISVSEVAPNKFRVLVFSMSSARLAGNGGNVVTFPIQVSNNIENGNYTVTMSSSEVTDDKLKDVLSATQNGAIRITNVVPSRTSLVSPASGSENVLLQPSLIWQAVEGGTTYTLQVSTSSDFSNPPISSAGLTNTEFDISEALSHNSLYYWRVKASNSIGEGAWSDVWTFTTQSVITSVSPEEGGEATIIIYPNPSSGKLIVTPPDGLSVEKIEVRSLRGELLFQNENLSARESVTLDLESLPSGTYLIILSGKGRVLGYKRWIKM